MLAVHLFLFFFLCRPTFSLFLLQAMSTCDIFLSRLFPHLKADNIDVMIVLFVGKINGGMDTNSFKLLQARIHMFGVNAIEK